MANIMLNTTGSEISKDMPGRRQPIRNRQLETLAANAVLKAVSDRYAPGTAPRILQYLGDRGAVAGLMAHYAESGDLEQVCTRYWDAMLEPDGLRLEDLVSTILISFATSYAASLLIDIGKGDFPNLWRRLVRNDEAEMALQALAKAEKDRRNHLGILLRLLDRKEVAAKADDQAVGAELRTVRHYIARGGTIGAFCDETGVPTSPAPTMPIETVVRGVLITEEDGESDFRAAFARHSYATLGGLPLSDNFGVGQIVHSRIDRVLHPTRTELETFIAELTRDIGSPLMSPHRHAALARSLRRPPKKIIPVRDHDWDWVYKCPDVFERWRPLIAAFVLPTGGMTCHTAVFSRGVGIACIQINEAGFGQLEKHQFAAIQSGTALLFNAPPNDLIGFM